MQGTQHHYGPGAGDSDCDGTHGAQAGAGGCRGVGEMSPSPSVLADEHRTSFQIPVPNLDKHLVSGSEKAGGR